MRAALAISPPGGHRCAGDSLTLDASASEAAGCGGPLEYRFTGPATDTGYTASPTATVVADNGATWTVAVRCAGNTSCNQSIAMSDATLDDSQAGRVRPDSLRVSREGNDVILTWAGTRAPVAYAVFRGSSARLDRPGRVAMLALLAPSPADV